MEIIELIDNINDEKEKIDICNDLGKVYEYKKYIIINHCSNNEIEKFIKEIIDKYRGNVLVGDFYNSTNGDNVSVSSFDNLCAIERMIYSYILRKLIINQTNQV